MVRWARWAVVSVVLCAAAGAGVFAADAPRAEVVEIPASYKTTAAAPALKCEGGSCWVYHGTTQHVNFAPAPVYQSCPNCAAGAAAPAPAPAPARCSSCERRESREVVSYDCDWRGR